MNESISAAQLIDSCSYEYLVGHQLRREDPSYDRISEEDRLSEYVKVIDLLTINPEHRLKKKQSESERSEDL